MNIKNWLYALLFAAGSCFAQQHSPGGQNGNPLAYTSNALGEWIVLSDKEDNTKCPPGAYMAYQRSGSREEVGCWITDERDVILMWLPNYTIVRVSKNSFERF